jgi:hypothetical protein
MIINDLDVFGVAVDPTKAQSKLVVDANAVLTCAIAFQGLQPIAWRRPQELQGSRGMQEDELSPSGRFNIDEAPDTPPMEQCLGIGASEGLDHIA